MTGREDLLDEELREADCDALGCVTAADGVDRSELELREGVEAMGADERAGVDVRLEERLDAEGTDGARETLVCGRAAVLFAGLGCEADLDGAGADR